jgi:hypothetical protein
MQRFNKKESRIPRIRGSVDVRENERKHNFRLSNEDNSASKERAHSAQRSYERSTLSSKNRNFLAVQKYNEDLDQDEEHESMEMQPPEPYHNIHQRPEIVVEENHGDDENKEEKIKRLEAKIKNYELRLLGTTKTIRSLEKDKREREQEIKLLQLELDKKDRFIDSLKSENSDPNIGRRKMSSVGNASNLLQQRKKEKDLETKVKELETTITDERKHMSRLQHLNTQLLSKIKGISNTEKNSQ